MLQYDNERHYNTFFELYVLSALFDNEEEHSRETYIAVKHCVQHGILLKCWQEKYSQITFTLLKLQHTQDSYKLLTQPRAKTID